MDTGWIAIISGISGVLVGLIPVAIKAYNDTKGSNHSQKISENAQAFELYKNLVENLQKNVTQLSSDMTKLEEAHISAREQNAELRVENRQLKEVILEYKKENERLEGLLKN